MLNATYTCICTAVYRYLKNYSEDGRGQRERERRREKGSTERGEREEWEEKKRGDDERKREDNDMGREIENQLLPSVWVIFRQL